MKERVVLLHGFRGNSGDMQPLNSYLQSKGHETINIAYNSWLPFPQIVENVNKDIPFAENCLTYFLGYSMGGVIERALYNLYHPENFGGIIQLGSPNHGSEWADKVTKIPFHKRIYGPAVSHLVTDQKTFEEIYGVVDYKLFVIAASKNYPFQSHVAFRGPNWRLNDWKLLPNDGRVTVESTRLKGMTEHIVLNDVDHTSLLTDPRVLDLAETAIKNLSFITAAKRHGLEANLNRYGKSGYQPCKTITDVTVENMSYWQERISERLLTDRQLDSNAITTPDGASRGVTR